MSGAGREHDRFVMMYHGTLTRIYELEIAIEASRMAHREMPGGAGRWLLYSWLPMSPDQEEQVCDVLVNLGWLENDHALHAEGVRVIRQVLGCSMDDAKAVLHDLRSRKLIDITITPGGELDTRKLMSVAKFRWERPPVQS
jgi:hypothetical protein